MANATKIPFLDLVTPHQELEAELLAVVKEAFRSAGFIGGPMVKDFERKFAAFCNTEYCVGVNSGTDALRFGFMAAGVEPGDIIVTVPHTFIATTAAGSSLSAPRSIVLLALSPCTCMDKRLIWTRFWSLPTNTICL